MRFSNDDIYFLINDTLTREKHGGAMMPMLQRCILAIAMILWNKFCAGGGYDRDSY
jgi:hypothetical protein